MGNTSVTGGALQVEFGGGISYKFVFFGITYEPGITEAVESGNEKFKYRMPNVSLGIRLESN